MGIRSRIFHFRKMRIKIKIEYDGSNYIGWQKQNSGRSIQKEIEDCLEELFGEKISVARTTLGFMLMDKLHI